MKDSDTNGYDCPDGFMMGERVRLRIGGLYVGDERGSHMYIRYAEQGKVVSAVDGQHLRIQFDNLPTVLVTVANVNLERAK